MNTVMYEQTGTYLARRVRRWDRRQRMATSAIWGPRGIIAGLIIGVVLTMISRTREWLFPEQILWITVAIVALSLAGSLALIWLWPRSTSRRARYFDRRFGLKERVSTAMEITAGVIPLPSGLVEHQLSDAVNTADRVNVKAYLPVRVRVLEIVALVLLAMMLGYLLFAPNRYTDEMKSRQALQQTINNQANALQQTTQQIQANSSLTQDQKDALTQPLNEAQQILKQPDVSQQEAVAALAEASQKLNDMGNGMSSSDQQSYQNAANELAGSDMTSNLSEALKQPDLGQTANALNNLSSQVPQSTQAQQQDLARKLDNAAQQLSESNPALAQKLREAANALRNGDTQAAQKALNEAADLARQQQQQLQNSPMAQAAQNAQQQTTQSQQAIAQSGRKPSTQAQANQPQTQQQTQQQVQNQQNSQQQTQGQQFSSQQQNGSQPQTNAQQQSQGQQGTGQQPGGQQMQGQPESGNENGSGTSQQSGQQGTGQNQSQAQGSGSSSPGQNPGSPSTTGQNGQTQGQQAGSTAPGAAQGVGSQEAGAGQVSAAQSEGAASGQSVNGGAALGAGEGAGGAGSNTTTGAAAPTGAGEISTNNSPGQGSLQEYNPVYSSSTIGGQSQSTVNVGGQSNTPGNGPIQQGDFGPNPTGSSTLSYTSVYGNYQGIVSDALESGRIPLDQRDVIHDYFASLAQ